MKNSERFVIRVYGIVLNEKHEVLLTDEFQLNQKMTKFPGGGLEFGEGTTDCLIREFKEECNGQEIMDIKHFYTTDYYQKALFYENAQLLSIYYLVKLKEPLKFRISNVPFDFEKMENGKQSFRWAKIKDLNDSEFTFPVDKFVAVKLKQRFAR